MKVIAQALLFLSVLSMAAPTLAEDAPPTHLRGTIAAMDGTTMTIVALDGAKTRLSLLPEARILVATPASLADVTPGTKVGVANSGPNGLQEALEVHILPDAATDTDGQSRWDLGRRSRMTIGRAGTKSVSYDGQDLTVKFNGDETTIQVRPNTPVVRLTAGARADLTSGASVFVGAGEVQPDGSIAASWLVVGRNGVKPPM